jgi:hypothetical protein
MQVIIRAYNADDYHRDIVVMDDVQVRMHDCRCIEPRSFLDGLIGVGMAIRPQDFPEMVRFEVIIKEPRRND